MNILIVEDEKRLAEALAQIMREHKYLCDVAYDGEDGYDYALLGTYDVIVLDVMLPKMSGFEVVKKLRKNHVSTPVLMLTAKDETDDKVTGLDCGADDYMTKPFMAAELLARIRALARRQGEVVYETLTFNDLTLKLAAYELACGGKSIHLGFKEFEVLKILMSNPTAITPKETLINRVWGADSEAEDNNVEAYISFLRKKFYYLGSKTGIETVRKVGYRLTEEEK